MSVENARKVLSDAEEACVSCEVCTESCEVLSQERLTIGEVVSRVLSGDASEAVLRSISHCKLCGRCCVGCPSDIQSKEAMIAAREVLGAERVAVFDNYKNLFLGSTLSVFSDYKDRYSISYDDVAREQCETVFFPGCSLSTYAPELTRAVLAWLERDGTEVSLLDDCCGAALACGGLRDREADAHRRLGDRLASMGAKRLIAPCPNCYYELGGEGKATWQASEVLGGVEIASLPALLLEAGMQVSSAETYTVHDSCPDREAFFIGAGVRRLLSGSIVMEMEDVGRHTMCCGSGGLVSSVDPSSCEVAADDRVGQYLASGADRLVTACASCSHRLSGSAGSGDVVHYLELVFKTPIDWDDVNRKLGELYDDELPKGPRDELL